MDDIVQGFLNDLAFEVCKLDSEKAFVSLKSGARSREPGAGSQEPGARSREPGAGSQEPGARSREPEAGNQKPGISGVCSSRAIKKTGPKARPRVQRLPRIVPQASNCH
jgi:hypothetical protein